jgi:hypothetical protein
VTDEELVEAYAVKSGLAPQSIDALRPDFPRWVRRLRSEGVTHTPTAPWTTSLADIRASNLLCQFIRQAAPAPYRDQTIEHNLRNLAGIRPHKA